MTMTCFCEGFKLLHGHETKINKRDASRQMDSGQRDKL